MPSQEIASKIPKDAKLVFKGVIWSVYQWKEKLFDGSEAIFEGLKRKDSVKIIAVNGSNMLLTLEEQPGSKPYYSIPGGEVEEGEQPIEAAKRELLEETGMVAEKLELLDKIDVLNFPHIDFYVYIFLAKNYHKEKEQNLDAGEKIKVLEVPFDQFIAKLKESKDRLGALAKLLDDQSKLNALKERLFSQSL